MEQLFEVVEPVMLTGLAHGVDGTFVGFSPGDVVWIVVPADSDGDVLARRRGDGLDQYISSASLVAL